MNNIKSFTIYKEYFELLDELPLDDKKELSVAILDYVFKDTEPILIGLNKAIFNNLKRPIDASKNKSKSARKDNQQEIKSKSNENQMKIKRYNTSMMLMLMSNINVNYILVKGVIGGKTFSKQVAEIINYLNEVCDKNYRTTSKKTRDLIIARLKDNFTIEDFKTVIDKKSQDKYFIENDYLRPETLFSNKFETYLNQKIVSKKQKHEDKVPDWHDKKIEVQEMTIEEKQQMEEILRKYRQ